MPMSRYLEGALHNIRLHYITYGGSTEAGCDLPGVGISTHPYVPLDPVLVHHK